jgi:hypothetical protein
LEKQTHRKREIKKERKKEKVVPTPASYSGGPEFKSNLGDRLS